LLGLRSDREQESGVVLSGDSRKEHGEKTLASDKLQSGKGINQHKLNFQTSGNQ
jgi:hypothetical protein